MTTRAAKAVFLIACLWLTTACDSIKQPRDNAVTQPISSSRFLPIDNPHNAALPISGALALDTKTGQLCETYLFIWPKENNQAWPSLPRCIDLYSDTEKTLANIRASESGIIDKEIMDAVKKKMKAEKEMGSKK